MQRNIELLAPGGDIDSIKAAIVAGADAVYCGLNRFNARNRATNLHPDDLTGVLNLAHSHNCKVFLTLNIVILESEIPALIRLLNTLVNTKVDAIIVQDLGLFHILSKHFKDLEVHASTQFNTHNEGQIHFLSKLGVNRANLARELDIHEIKALTALGKTKNIATEVFVHGSYCLSFSGLCYMSSVTTGRSGNRGRCSQPCRDRYETTAEGKAYPLNLKDNSAFADVRELAEAGVASLKIEGRIKKCDYVYSVVNCWSRQLRYYEEEDRVGTDNRALCKAFNRDFSDGYLKGEISKQMFIDNPRDYAIKQLSERDRYPSREIMDQNRVRFYEEKEETTALINEKIGRLSIEKKPLSLSVSGHMGAPLEVSVHTPDTSFTLRSEKNLEKKSGKSPSRHLDCDVFLEKFNSLNSTGYDIRHIKLDGLEPGLYICLQELSAIKQKIHCLLNGSKEYRAPIDTPVLNKHQTSSISPSLSVLVSSIEDVRLCETTSATLFFQLPSHHENIDAELIDVFQANRQLIPWFPPVLIGKDYTAALDFLEQVKPDRLVTDNTGIAFHAFKKEIPWIAGPSLNIVNSFGLFCLKETFNCAGAFVSNEISKKQLKRIAGPEGFQLYYSLYHPIPLLTSRQCLVHQVTGCEKERMDDACLRSCQKSATIAPPKKMTFFIEKSKGNYHQLYNNKNYLNTEVVTDLPGKFSHFCVDLRDIKTETETEADKPRIIELFENLIAAKPGAKEELTRMIHPTTCAQYKKGI